MNKENCKYTLRQVNFKNCIYGLILFNVLWNTANRNAVEILVLGHFFHRTSPPRQLSPAQVLPGHFPMDISPSPPWT